jgi:hypothetical protein
MVEFKNFLVVSAVLTLIIFTFFYIGCSSKPTEPNDNGESQFNKEITSEPLIGATKPMYIVELKCENLDCGYGGIAAFNLRDCAVILRNLRLAEGDDYVHGCDLIFKNPLRNIHLGEFIMPVDKTTSNFQVTFNWVQTGVTQYPDKISLSCYDQKGNLKLFNEVSGLICAEFERNDSGSQDNL